MNEANTLRGLIEQSLRRTQEATMGVLNIANDELRGHIRKQMLNHLGDENCFLADPVIEHTFGWKCGQASFYDLMNKGLLSHALITILNEAVEDYRFTPEMYPYEHQVEAWSHLLSSDPKSAIITSGTGSGKTECFMIPILEDLIRSQQLIDGGSLQGVQALFLYPLNALINSQKERLDAWTSPFGKKIRYCLYNGNTKEESDSTDKDFLNEVRSRELLRKEPPPILLTNATMLEYMLIRQSDAPILSISKEKQSLRWIVLDEAHSYMGSQAAEIALLLRRVVHAFGKRSGEIRFVATSATIASKDAEHQLKRFLADLAGVSESQVLVITGSRHFEPIDLGYQQLPLEAIRTLDFDVVNNQLIEVSPTRYQALRQHVVASSLRQIITHSKTPVTLNELVVLCQQYFNQSNSPVENQQLVLDWLDVMVQTKNTKETESFLKMRLHLFQGMLHGLWACADVNCDEKSAFLKKWGFGQVYLNQKSRCNCGAPIFELVLCSDCGEPHLVLEEKKGYLQQCSTFFVDEFSLSDREVGEHDGSTDSNESEDNITATSSFGSLIAASASHNNEQYSRQRFDKLTNQLGIQDTNSSHSIELNFATEHGTSCVACQYVRTNQPFYTKQYLGAPFYTSHAVPTILEFCAPIQNNQDLPAQGRRLVTFTDSRQGTARMAIKMQQDAEYSKLRGLVFEVLVSKNQLDNNNEENIEKQKIIDAVMEQDISEFLRKQILNQLMQPTANSKNFLTWDELLRELKNKKELSQHLLAYNKDIHPVMFSDNSGNGAFVLAELLMIREFARRPRNANSSETLGMIAIHYPDLDRIKEAPASWCGTQVAPSAYQSDSTLNLADWKDFLTMVLDFYIRENSFVPMSEMQKRWLGRKFSAKSFLPPSAEKSTVRYKVNWPVFKAKQSQYSRIIKILLTVTGLDRATYFVEDKINIWLQTAWEHLTVVTGILEPDNDTWRMPLSKLAFSLPQKLWLCPRSHRLISTTFRGVTPYLPQHFLESAVELNFCKLIDFVDLSSFKQDGSAVPRRYQMRQLISKSHDVEQLRQDGLWNNLCDKIVEGGFYYRSAEHSAQLSAARLKRYETDFKVGKVNVLSCSTTMEMGVDIGGMAAVVMNNVPPHPANYLQRAGRAGRRSESAAIAYTLCKADPHNKRVFSNPIWPFTTNIAAPKVSLSSNQIVARHVHSLMLSEFLKCRGDTNGNNTKLNSKWFFYLKTAVWRQFCEWFSTPDNLILDLAIKDLIFGTSLVNTPLAIIKKHATDELFTLAEEWQAEFRIINEKMNQAEGSYKKALTKELKNHEGENLLSFLAVKAFLPSYGFPTNVVQLSIRKMGDYYAEQISKQREDNLFIQKEAPSRSLDVGLREYAPGAQVVLDGKVYQSAGINLKVKTAGIGTNEAQQINTAWRCDYCGTSGVSQYAYSHGQEIKCYRCGSDIKHHHKQNTLVPAGFLTDFYEETTNDVTSQKFIQMQLPVVQLQGVVSSLPSPDCGEIHYGSKGNVFYQSPGEYGYGYAICMSCGRSESMRTSEEIPKQLSEETHKPLGGGIEIGKREKVCSVANVKRNIYLSHRIRTDVLEIALKNPITRTWLNKHEPISDSVVVAKTLAVAIRDQIAEFLGIETTEMGFSIREDKDLEVQTARQIIQIYDRASGGAGFVLSAVDDINHILLGAFKRLECAADCDSVCQYCLASGDSHVEREELNRKLALEWLEKSELINHLVVPSMVSQLPGARYSALSSFAYLEKILPRLAKSTLCIYLQDEYSTSMLENPTAKASLMQWHFLYQCQIVICLGEGFKLDNQRTKNLLRPFVESGFKIARQNSQLKGLFLTAQVADNKGLYSLLYEKYTALFDVPNTALYVSDSVELNQFPHTFIDTAQWFDDVNTKILRFNTELDGDLDSFGHRLLKMINPVFNLEEIVGDDFIVGITYTDRYLKSPLMLLLFSNIIQCLFELNQKKFDYISIKAAKSKYGKYASEKVWDNWLNSSNQQEVYEDWFAVFSDDIQVNMACESYQLPHGRLLEIKYKSGKVTTIAFDQGMGYWSNCHIPKDALHLIHFPFEQDIALQILQLKEYLNVDVMIKTPYAWETYIVIEYSK